MSAPRKRSALTAVTDLLLNLSSLLLIVVALFEFDNTPMFLKLTAWLGAAALIQIAGEIRDVRKALER